VGKVASCRVMENYEPDKIGWEGAAPYGIGA
jgi:hypothetical protein